MSNEERRARRNYLRKAIAEAERQRAEHMQRFPADTSGNHDFGKHIGLLARELRGIGGGDLRDNRALDRTD